MLLTALAVVIGVMMVSGTLVLTDTMQKAFDGILTASNENTGAVIAGKEIVKGSQSGAATVRAPAGEGPGAAGSIPLPELVAFTLVAILAGLGSDHARAPRLPAKCA